METKILEEIGLTNNEITVYLTLLKLGSTTTGSIITEAKIASSRVYVSLENLIERGLVSYFVKNNRKYFRAEDPDNIIKEIEEIKNKVQGIIPQLKELKPSEEKEEYTTIYEGFKGFRTAFEKQIDVCEPKDEILVLGLSPQTYAFESLRTFLKNIDLRRYKKKIKLRVLLDKKLKSTIGKDREEEPYTEVKYMPENYFSPAGMNIFKDYVMLLIWEEKPFIFMIKNSKIVDSFRQYFELLWQIAKKP